MSDQMKPVNVTFVYVSNRELAAVALVTVAVTALSYQLGRGAAGRWIERQLGFPY